MKQSVWNRPVPSLLVFFFLIASFFTVSFLAQKSPVSLFSRASPNQEPQDVTISNISDTSFNISYHTSDKIFGSIVYGGGSSLDNVALDDRDHGNPQPHTVHFITIKNLKANTSYSFKILSNSTTYDKNGSPYVVTTGKTLQAVRRLLLNGTIVFPSGIPTEALVYISASGSSILAGLADPTGKYSLDINQLRSANGADYFKPTAEYTLSVRTSTQHAQAVFNFDPLAPIPPITLGNNYEFSTSIVSQSANTSSSSASFPGQTINLPIQKKVTITIPSDGQAFTVQRPTLSGTSAPYAVVSIIIHSDEQIQTTVQADSKGFWSFTPQNPLSPGKHTLTITAKDALLVNRTLQTTFYVYTTYAQFLQPSVSPIEPTSTLIPTVSPTPGIGGGPSSTPIPSPTATPIVSPIVIPTETPIITLESTLTSTPAVSTPVSGNDSAFLATLIAIIPVILGGLLFYLSKGIIR